MNYPGNYSIKDLEKLSGIKAHTIRIWELRYHLLKPRRTETNIRFYDDEQLKRLLNIALLLKSGIKVSKIGIMNEKEIRSSLLALHDMVPMAQNSDELINSLIVSMIELNEQLFEKVFSSSLIRLGFEKTITDVIYPFLIKIGLLWSIGDIQPAQEHFISNLIRQKLIAGIDGQLAAKKNKGKFLLFLPEGEYHEIGLLLADYIIRQSGSQTVYLGQNVPRQDAFQVYSICAPEKVLFFLTVPKPKEELKQLLNFFSEKFENSEIYFSGNLPPGFLKKYPAIQELHSVDELKKIL
jgi:DNA-binding transcriptional MerR regulator